MRLDHLFSARASLGDPEKASPENRPTRWTSKITENGLCFLFFVGEREILKIGHRLLWFYFLFVLVFDFASKRTIIIVLYWFRKIILLVFIRLFLSLCSLFIPKAMIIFISLFIVLKIKQYVILWLLEFNGNFYDECLQN